MKQIGTKNKYARKTRTGQHFERVFPLKTEIFCIKDKKEHGFPFNRFLIGGGKNHALFIVFFYDSCCFKAAKCPPELFRKNPPVSIRRGSARRGSVRRGRKLSGEKLPGKRDLTVRFSVRKTESAISAFFTREGKRRRYQAGKCSWGGFAGRKPDTWG